MLLLATLFGLAEPQEMPAIAPIAPAYVLLADEARRARLEAILTRLDTKNGYREAEESGLFYIGCVTAWRDNPTETETCIRSRLPRSAERSLIVLNSYGGDTRKDRTSLSCVGAGGTGQAILPDRLASGDEGAIEACLREALEIAHRPMPGYFPIDFADHFAIENVDRARAAATTIVIVAIDHVGYPRGISGFCLVQGRLARIEQGSPVATGNRTEIRVPCGIGKPDDRRRRVQMANLGPGRFARLFLNDRQSLLHIEPTED